MFEHLLNGLVLGGTYALVAMGLTLQYGIARIMNLSYGDTIITASFAAYVLFTGYGVSPLTGLVLVVPAGFAFAYLVFSLIMRPLVNRSANSDVLEVDSILATFGLLFVIQGVLLVIFGGSYTGYSYLNKPVEIFGAVVALNRLIALLLAVVLGGALVFILMKTRWGLRMRAVAISADSARLVAIDVLKTSRVAFALGGALAASGGVVVSMYQTFTVTSGVVFTMKALIVVILGGKGSLTGALIAGLILGLVETLVAAYVDPGLTLAATYTIFLALLLIRPSGLFGKAN